MGTPFDNLFSPSNSSYSDAPTPPRAAAESGSILGFVDHLMGVPTSNQIAYSMKEKGRLQDEGKAQGQSGALADIMGEVQTIREQNPTAQPNQIYGQLVKSPVFLKNAMRIPSDQMNAMVKGIIDSGQPAKDTYTAISSGQGMVKTPGDGSAPSMVSGAAMPPSDVQSGQWLQKQNPDQLAALQAGRTADAGGPKDGKTAKERAAADMVMRGMITPAQATEFIADRYDHKILQDQATGAPTGYAIIDKAGGGTPQVFNFRDFKGADLPPSGIIPPFPGQRGYVAPTVQNGPMPQGPLPPRGQLPNGMRGTIPDGEQPSNRLPPEAPQGQGQGQPRQSFRPNRPIDVIDYAGMVGVARGAVASVTGQIDPRLDDPAVHYARAKMTDLATTIRELKDSKEFASEVKEMQFNVPSPRDPTTTPIAMGMQYLMAAEKAEAWKRRYDEMRSNPGDYSVEERRKFSGLRTWADKILENTGSSREISDKIDALSAGNGGDGGNRVGGTLKSIGSSARQAGEAITGNKPDPEGEILRKLDDASLAGIKWQDLTPERQQKVKQEVLRRKALRDSKRN